MARAHEEEKRHDGKEHHKRARGGRTLREHEDKLRDAAEDKKKREERKHGGKVHGEKSKNRPDRRARGGATSDANPMSSAGKMSKPEYETKDEPEDKHGRGNDKE